MGGERFFDGRRGRRRRRGWRGWRGWRFGTWRGGLGIEPAIAGVRGGFPAGSVVADHLEERERGAELEGLDLFAREGVEHHVEGLIREAVDALVEVEDAATAGGVQSRDEYLVIAAPVVDGGAVDAGLGSGGGDRGSIDEQFGDLLLLRGERGSRRHRDIQHGSSLRCRLFNCWRGREQVAENPADKVSRML
jgi:hypothetical protein